MTKHFYVFTVRRIGEKKLKLTTLPRLEYTCRVQIQPVAPVARAEPAAGTTGAWAC